MAIFDDKLMTTDLIPSVRVLRITGLLFPGLGSATPRQCCDFGMQNFF